MDTLNDALLYLIKIGFDLYILTIILRILLQLIKIDYVESDAPFKEFIFSVTNIPLKIIGKIIPKIGRVDIGAILLALLLKIIEITLLTLFGRGIPAINGLLVWTFAALFAQLFNLYFYLVLFRIFISWLAPQQETHILHILDKLTAPIIKPIHRVIPVIGGFDISPVIALVLLQLAIVVIVSPLTQMGMRLAFSG